MKKLLCTPLPATVELLAELAAMKKKNWSAILFGMRCGAILFGMRCGLTLALWVIFIAMLLSKHKKKSAPEAVPEEK